MARSRQISVFAYYRITWQLLITLTSALAIASDAVRPWVGIPFFMIAFFLMTPFGGVLGKEGSHRKRLSISLGIALTLLTMYQMTRISHVEELVEVMLELICGFLPLVLLNYTKPRSYWIAILDVTVIAVGSISVASSMFIYLGFLLFIAVLLLNLNAANLYLPDAAGDFIRDDIGPGYFRQFLMVLPIGLLSAALIFMLFPRMQSFTMSLGKFMSKPRAGYSGAIELSGGGELGSSSALAFVVEAPDLQWLRVRGPNLLFRGDALDTFDGVRWSSTVFEFRKLEDVPDLRVTNDQDPSINMLVIHAEPMAFTTVFYPDILINVNRQSRNAGQFLFNANGSIMRESVNFDRFDYSLRVAEPLGDEDLQQVFLSSDSSLGLQEKQRQMTAPPYELPIEQRRTYLALPETIRNAEWWSTWRSQVRLDFNLNVAALRKQIDQFFASNYTATLENNFSSTNAFETFLTKDKRGHCEYFATATALLLRSWGIPARVVVGYKGGIYNEISDVLEVREDHAHAWVEAHAEGIGWITFDPTPPGAQPSISALMAKLQLYVNAASFLFRQYVVDYDYQTQRDIVRSIRNATRSQRSSDFDWKNLAKNMVKPAIVGGLVVIAMLYLMRRRWRRGLQDRLPIYWRQFEHRMERLGKPRIQGETYRQYCARMLREVRDWDMSAMAAREIIDAIAVAIDRDLYSPKPLSDRERLVVAESVLLLCNRKQMD